MRAEWMDGFVEYFPEEHVPRALVGSISQSVHSVKFRQWSYSCCSYLGRSFTDPRLSASTLCEQQTCSRGWNYVTFLIVRDEWKAKPDKISISHTITSFHVGVEPTLTDIIHTKLSCV